MRKMKIQYCGADTALVPVIVISILDLFFSTIVIVLVSYFVYMVNNPMDLEKVVTSLDPERTGDLGNFLRQTTGEQVMALTVPLISYILGFLMAIFLMISAFKKCLNALRIWFILTMIFMIIQITIFIIHITMGRNTAVFIVTGMFEYVYRGYALWVVHCLTKEIIAVNEEKANDSEDTVVVEADSE